jgi:hypothetical protein
VLWCQHEGPFQGKRTYAPTVIHCGVTIRHFFRFLSVVAIQMGTLALRGGSKGPIIPFQRRHRSLKAFVGCTHGHGPHLRHPEERHNLDFVQFGREPAREGTRRHRVTDERGAHSSSSGEKDRWSATGSDIRNDLCKLLVGSQPCNAAAYPCTEVDQLFYPAVRCHPGALSPLKVLPVQPTFSPSCITVWYPLLPSNSPALLFVFSGPHLGGLWLSTMALPRFWLRETRFTLKTSNGS